MLPLLGALALESLDTAVIANILRYGLMTLGATLIGEQLKEEPKKVDVFDSKPETDALADLDAGTSSGVSSSGASSSSSSGSSVGGPSDVSTGSGSSTGTSAGMEDNEENTGIGENENEVSGNYTVPSVGGSSLLDVLTSSGQATSQGLSVVATSVGDLRKEVRWGFDGVAFSINNLKKEVVTSLGVVANALRSQGIILGGMGLALNKLAEVFTTPVSVNPEEHITTARNPLEMIAMASGVQAKTFADINSFDAEGDLPDLPDGIDISQIFKFLRVSQQLRG